MKLKNRFYENVITIIDPNGKIIDTKRNRNENSHPQAFTRIEKEQIPGLFEKYVLYMKISRKCEFSFLFLFLSIIFPFGSIIVITFS